jgi:PAS domain S-box-containing protein
MVGEAFLGHALTILLVDANADDRALAAGELRRELGDVAILEIVDAAGLRRALDAGGIDAVVTDYRLGWGTGLEVLGAVKAQHPDCPVIIFTATGGEEIAVEAMKGGLSDYVMKLPGLYFRLPIAVRNALERHRRALALEDAQSRLRVSEERFRVAAQCASDLVYEWDIAADRLEWLGDAERLLGYDPGEVPARMEAWVALIHPDDVERVRAAGRLHVETGAPYAVEYRVRRRDGTYLIWSDRGTGLKNEGGALVRWIGVVSDVTARRQAQAQVRDYAERLRVLAEVSRALTENISDHQTALRAVSRHLSELIGDLCVINLASEDRQWLVPVAISHRDPQREELLRDLIDSNPQRADEEVGGYVFQSGESVLLAGTSTEAMRTRVKPEYHPYLDQFGVASVIGVPLRVDGASIGTVFVTRDAGGAPYTREDLALLEDIADRASLAVNNARLFHEAQRANRLKDEFLATVSHELRTPLNSILGWARLLASGVVEPENIGRAIDTIERNAQAQAHLIEELLDVSRIITGKLSIDLLPVELGSVVAQAVDSARPTAAAKSVDLRLGLLGGEHPVLGDASRLQQVVWNLLSNAIKFTPKGGRVEVRLERADQHAQITVGDSGQGIAPEFLPYVFDRFRQADSTLTREHGGLGLGLAIVRHLVDMHGGTVMAESDGEGRGATFVVRLPLSDTTPANRRRASDAEGQVPARFDCPPGVSGARVLAVDDECDSLEIVAAVLRRCGAEVRTAPSSAAALEELARWGPDVIVSDISMPGEDGYALIRKVRALDPEAGGRVPAIALTAYARAEDRALALSSGYQVHIPKPVDPSELLAAVSSLVARDPVRRDPVVRDPIRRDLGPS